MNLKEIPDTTLDLKKKINIIFQPIYMIQYSI